MSLMLAGACLTGCGERSGPSLVMGEASDGSSVGLPSGLRVTTLTNSVPPGSAVYDGGLAISASGDLYAGTSGAGILKLSSPSFAMTSYNTSVTYDVRGLAFDSHGTLWATATSDDKVFSITAAGAANPPINSGNHPTGLAVAPNDDVFYLATNAGELRKISGGIDSLVIGIGAACYGIAIDQNSAIYMSCQSDHSIYKLEPPSFLPNLFAGNGTGVTVDGTGAGAGFNTPYGLAVDSSGNVYVTEGQAFGGGGNVIRKISPGGVVTTIAGDGTAATTDGIGRAAQFMGPIDIAVGPTGTLFVQEIGIAGGNVIRRID